ncbi:MAG: polysaccharide deacetylase family protein [Clostridia bacterium]
MFLVFSKEKIFTYLISVLTVTLLFVGVANYQTKGQDIIEASSNTGKLLPIYKVKTEQKKVALTMNCAWNADDIDKILEVLKENNVKITFFMVGDWIDKYPEAVKKINDAGQEIRKSQRHTSTCK